MAKVTFIAGSIETTVTLTEEERKELRRALKAANIEVQSHHRLFLNGAPTTLDTPVKDGDEVGVVGNKSAG